MTRASDAILATADTDRPCVHGHFDCAQVDGGPCSAEAFARLASAGLSTQEIDRLAAPDVELCGPGCDGDHDGGW